MENAPADHESPRLTMIMAGFISGLKLVGKTMATADLNPHEGRLRASLMPAEYMNIPDTLPANISDSTASKSQ